jgi:pyruvate kinase
MYMANHTQIRGIAALTESGTTPLLMSRISSGIPIFALSSQEKTLGKATLYRGVTPIYFSHEAQNHVEVNRDIIAQLRCYDFAKEGDQFIITKGDLIGSKGGTNDLKVVTVGDELTP